MVDLETAVAAANVDSAGSFGDPQLAASSALIAANETEHLAILAATFGRPGPSGSSVAPLALGELEARLRRTGWIPT